MKEAFLLNRSRVNLSIFFADETLSFKVERDTLTIITICSISGLNFSYISYEYVCLEIFYRVLNIKVFEDSVSSSGDEEAWNTSVY